MKKIAVVTSTRAEFGLLCPLIRELRKYESTNVHIELIVTGTHLSYDFGYTVDEIRNNGLRIDVELEIPVASDTPLDTSNNQAIALKKFTELFLKKKYAGIVILGDRYEMLSIAIAAGNTHTAIFHLCGGDTTEGAIDEWIRHSITKMSYMHFPTNEISRNRIIQMGENPDKVFNFGSTGIDNIVKLSHLSKEIALKKIGLNECKYALCTYHPVTMEDEAPEVMIDEFICAIKEYPQIKFIITKANSDFGGEKINRILEEKVKYIENIHVFSSLGSELYLSLMKHAEFVLGNSSSGILETPFFGIPTINIGDRQRGRLQSKSIINCGSHTSDILNAINVACSDNFRGKLVTGQSPYGTGKAAYQIAKKIANTVLKKNIDLKKKFYDLSI